MGKITIIEEDLGVVQRGEVVFQHCKFREDKSTVTVSTALLTINFPCDSGHADIALNESDNEYTATWDVPSDATYGEYTTEVAVIDNDGNTFIFQNFFVVLPWHLISQVRSISGIKQSNDISDGDIALIAWNSYLEVKEDIFERRVDERLYSGIHSEATHYFVSGGHILNEYLDCGEEAISAYWVDCNEKEIADISLVDEDTGEVSVDEVHSCKLYATYRVKSANFSENLFRKAVMYLTTHEVILRFNELDKATLADLQSNSPLVIANPNRMYDKYKQVVNKIKVKTIDGW